MAGGTANCPRENDSTASLPFTKRDSRLCFVCADIDFNRYLGEKIERALDLGSWSSICQSLRCPFCRLVTRCLESDPSLTPRLPNTRVYLDNELSWKLGIEYSPYDRSKSESYSNKFDLRSLAGKCFLDAYRFTVTAGRSIGKLLNSHKECVGEIITTHGRARLRRDSNDFLTISWGLSLQYAEIHDSYIPRWRFSSKAGKNSIRAIFNDDYDTCLDRLMTTEIGFAPIFLEPWIQKYSRYIPKETMLVLESTERPNVSGSQLFHEVYFAQKGQPRPRSLWTVVNLMLVDWDGHLARRAGVGKVIIRAWHEKWNQPQEVILT